VNRPEAAGELQALRDEVAALRLTNEALQGRLSADAVHYDAMLREIEAKRDELVSAGRRQLDLAAFTQRVIDAVGSSIIVLDPEGTVVRINLVASHYLGIKLPAPAALHFDAWMDGEELARLRASFPTPPWAIKSVPLEAARYHGQLNGEYRLRGATGSWHCFLLETTLLYNRQGKEEGAVICATDVQAMKDVEVDLRLAASVFENSRNGITITDAQAIIRRVNGAFSEILGYRAEECVGQPVSLIKSGVHDAEFYEDIWRSLAVNGRWQGEIVNRHKDGNLVYIWESIAAVYDKHGAISYYVANFVDISKQKELERELRAAKDAAEAGARAKGDFLANMSHEIRTPMNGIIGLLKLLSHTPLDTTQHDYVTKAANASASLLGILNDILDYSKVAAGKMQLEHQPFSLAALMQDIGIIASANLGERPLELVYNIGAEVPDQLLGDALRLKQVLTNLIGNAIKFTPSGDIVVDIACVQADTAEVELGIAVRDTGIGIPSDKLAAIFESFGQADASTTRKFGGTGLGLAISQSLVALMGGNLQVDSKPGVGSRFHFNVRLGRAGQSPALATGYEAAVVVDPATGLPLGKQLRTLIVDDNDSARLALCDITERFGWPTTVAASGSEALALCAEAADRDEDFQLVLMDWKMPNMDGFSVTRQLRSREDRGRRSVIILLTAFDPGHLLRSETGSRDLFDSILIKPVTESTMLDTVMRTRAGRHRHSAPARTPVAAGPRRLEGMRVLVVDDSDLNRLVANGLLSLEGAQVECVDGGLAAIACLEDKARQAPDVVLMDVQMPDIDGYEATRRLRDGGCRLPILAMTANVMESDIVAAEVVGMNAHIAKPIDLDNLVAKLTYWVAAAAGGVAPAEVTPPLVVPPLEATLRLPAAEAVIDVKAALLRLGGRRAIYRKVTAGFLGEASRQLEQLGADIAAGTLDSGQPIVHTLKGLAGTVGATELAAVALLAKNAWKGGIDARRAGELCVQMREVLVRTDTALRKVLEELDAS